MTRYNPAHVALLEHESDEPSGQTNEPKTPPLFPPDPDWYEEPLVEDSFGQPIFAELMTSSAIFHAAIPPIDAPVRWNGVWAGIGCMSDNGLPFDSLEMAIGLQILARRLHCPASLLIADAHALTTGGDERKVHARAERLADDVRRIFDNLEFSCEVFLASSLRDNPAHQAFLALANGWERNLEPGLSGLPPYLKLGMADSAYMALNNRLKVGWSTSATPTIDEGRFHEPATDLRARHLQCTFGGIYTRPGFTLRGDRPKAVPYTELAAPEDRFMLTGGHQKLDYRGQIATANRSAKALRNLELRVGLITSAFEQEFGHLEGDTIFHKAESLARIATVGL
jgi:hypothetical protein